MLCKLRETCAYSTAWQGSLLQVTCSKEVSETSKTMGEPFLNSLIGIPGLCPCLHTMDTHFFFKVFFSFY